MAVGVVVETVTLVFHVDHPKKAQDILSNLLEFENYNDEMLSPSRLL